MSDIDATFTVTITSVWGDTWEWIGVSGGDADAIYRRLETPNAVQLISTQRTHAGQPLEEE